MEKQKLDLKSNFKPDSTQKPYIWIFIDNETNKTVKTNKIKTYDVTKLVKYLLNIGKFLLK